MNVALAGNGILRNGRVNVDFRVKFIELRILSRMRTDTVWEAIFSPNAMSHPRGRARGCESAGRTNKQLR